MTGPGYFDEPGAEIDEFAALIASETSAGEVPRSAAVESGVPIYDASRLLPELTGAGRRELQAEWAEVLAKGAGVLVIRGMIPEPDTLDQASQVFLQIIDEERQSSEGEGDHFAAVGSNQRIWNSLQKLCLRAPDVFARYFGNVTIDAICEAWLGPAYQMTAQVNLVHPGGKAQSGHRDYHLGFMSAAQARDYPAHVHCLSPLLTLQGAVAHCDMPIASGPTKLLPHSQKFAAGYAVMNHAAVQQVFEDNFVQLPLQKGDGLFFNPALMHAAGENISGDIERMANLLQVSSAFGRAMESLDRERMCLALYPSLQAGADKLGAGRTSAAIAACAEGYAFPTNLDRDPPLEGMAPESQAALMQRCLAEKTTLADFTPALQLHSQRKLAD